MRLLHPHPWHDSQADLSQHSMSHDELIAKWGNITRHVVDSLFVVKDVCTVCGDCVELERLFTMRHFDEWDDGGAVAEFEVLEQTESVPPRFAVMRCEHFHNDLDSDSLPSRNTSPPHSDDGDSDNEGVLV